MNDGPNFDMRGSANPFRACTQLGAALLEVCCYSGSFLWWNNTGKRYRNHLTLPYLPQAFGEKHCLDDAT